MGSLYRRQAKRGTPPEGQRRCPDKTHSRADVCPTCDAHFTGPFWVKYYRNGRPIRESTETMKETEARDFLKRREGDVASGRLVKPKAGKVRVEELLDDLVTDYKANDKRSLEGVTRIVERLKKDFGHRRAHDLTTADVQRYVVERQTAPTPDAPRAANATINRELAALKRAFNLGVKGEKILRKPHIPMLDEHNTRKGFLGEIEYLALRNALPTPINHMLAFAYVTGWRKSEVLALTWDRVDLQAGTVRLDPDTTKNDEGRLVVLTDELRTLFTSLWTETRALAALKGHPIPWVFHRNGKPVKDFRKAWETACTAAGLGGKIPHDLRRTAVRNMERAGVPRSVAMKITGHKTEAIYRRYAIVSEAELREAARKLSGDTVSGTIPGTVGHSDSPSSITHPDNPSE